MKLKRLVLQGYKTFATKTEFLFDDGITAIVGPNGSGKSNIADAVRWVLGEQSYSTLRGKRTIDMIFAGSQTRPRAGMAQAILTLDNSDGWLPIDYTEVEIGRRAYRSGENEYILNGQKVRLKDVMDLLATSGLAERTYTMIGQGLVDQALSLRAEERRALFEEAAGINHYKSRRAETLRRLQETQQNLQRVHDILAEIRPRLTSLKRQATRAQNYEQLAADLRHLLQLWYGYRWEQAKQSLRHARETAAGAEMAWQESRQRLRVLQENIDEVRRSIHRRQQKTAETQHAYEEMRDQLETARREAAILQERRQSVERQLAELGQEFPPLEQQRQAAEDTLALALSELAAAQAELNHQQEQLRLFNTNFQAQQTEISRWQQTLQESEREQQIAQTRLAQAEGQLNQLRERLREREAEAASGDETETAQLEEEIEKATAVVDAARQQVQQAKQRRSEQQETRQALIRQIKQLRREYAGQEQQLNQQRRELARLETRVEMLNQMQRQDTSIRSDAHIIGNLASLLTIPDAYRPALEAALKTRLATLLVPDEANLWQLAADAGQETGLLAAAQDGIRPAPDVEAPADTAVIGWASDLVSCQAAARPLVQLLLGPILLVQDRAAAYRVGPRLPLGTMAVAADGFTVYAGGLVEISGQTGPETVLARKEAWRTAQDALSQLKDEVAGAEETAVLQQALIQEKQAEIDKLQDEEQQLIQREQEASQQLSQAQRTLDRATQRQTFLAQQQAAHTQEVTRLQIRIREIEQAVATYQERKQQLAQKVSQARARLDALPVTEGQQQQESRRQAINAAQTIVAGRQAVVDSRQATLNQLDNQLNRLKTRQEGLRQQQAQLTQSEKKDRWVQLNQQMQTLTAELQPLRMRLAQSRQELAELEDEAAVLQKQTHDRETLYTQAKIAFTQQQNAIEGLQERIKADLGVVALHYDEDQIGPTPLPISGIEQLPQVIELPDDIEETIQNYRGQMQRMGAINLDAPAEYQETQTRYDFLTEQIEDLEQTERQLRQVIAELDELTSRAFAQTVDQVNQVFGQTFTQLFGGGNARLVLTDPDNLTISGVDIVARLPNRREQGLGLLSGGERSLTAAALIFSLLKVSPPPFCMLDEVDAALDEANINRFRELLRELSLKTQLVIITHNRGTVQAAQTIYGVSMGNDSASQSISIKPEDYVRQPELV